MSRFPALLLALPLLAVAGCQPFRPPSPATLKVIKAQTLTGPLNTKVRAKPFTYPVKSGELSLWDIKVFNTKDKPNGMLQEWKTFAQIPQQPNSQINNTQVLMNGWIISKDGRVFLPQKVTYKAYGSFYTDWTLPRPGDYTLWVEYMPSIAENEELSMGELMNRKASFNLPREVGYWNFTASGESLPTEGGAQFTSSLPFVIPAYDAKGVAREKVSVNPPKVKVRQKVSLAWTVDAATPPTTSIQNPEIVAIAPDNSTLLHGIGKAPEMKFEMLGEWKIWFSYTRGEQTFAAPYVLKVAP